MAVVRVRRAPVVCAGRRSIERLAAQPYSRSIRCLRAAYGIHRLSSRIGDDEDERALDERLWNGGRERCARRRRRPARMPRHSRPRQSAIRGFTRQGWARRRPAPRALNVALPIAAIETSANAYKSRFFFPIHALAIDLHGRPRAWSSVNAGNQFAAFQANSRLGSAADNEWRSAIGMVRAEPSGRTVLAGHPARASRPPVAGCVAIARHHSPPTMAWCRLKRRLLRNARGLALLHGWLVRKIRASRAMQKVAGGGGLICRNWSRGRRESARAIARVIARPATRGAAAEAVLRQRARLFAAALGRSIDGSSAGRYVDKVRLRFDLQFIRSRWSPACLPHSWMRTGRI